MPGCVLHGCPENKSNAGSQVSIPHVMVFRCTTLACMLAQVASSPELVGTPAYNQAESGYSGQETPAGYEQGGFASGRPQTSTPDTSPTKARRGILGSSYACYLLAIYTAIHQLWKWCMRFTW